MFFGIFVLIRVLILSIFVLNRVSILSIFVLNRVSFLRQEPITLFLDDKQLACVQTSPISFVARGKGTIKEIGDVCTQANKQPALMFYECLKLGIKNWNSVLNRVGKSAIFVLNRVRV